MTGRSLKIACLHGYCQNAHIFRLKSGSLRKYLQRNVNQVRATITDSSSLDLITTDDFALAELIYLDAPYVLEERIPPPTQTPTADFEKYVITYSPPPLNCLARPVLNGTDRTKRSWWTAEENGRIYSGWEASFEHLRNTFREKKFDGVLGFSQGAIVASLISAMKNNNHATENAFESLKFSIMISGFPSRAPVHKELYETPIDVPSMHVWGQLDTLVPNIGSKMLLEKFQLDNRQHFIHHKGHLVPSDSASRKAISAFLLKISDEINARDEETLRAAL